jgi:signal transduction histidine kinase
VIMTLEEGIPEALGFIDASVSELDRLVTAIRNLSSLSHREIRRKPVDMNTLIQATLDRLTDQIKERQVTVTVGPLPEVVADQAAMEEIMIHLLRNAVLYLDPERPGAIEITAEQNHDETLFRVQDNGRGIAEGDKDKVFAPFRRAGRQDVPGEGMGLPYVQTLVRRHGGRIRFVSEVGVGTTFTFTISHDLTEGGICV